MNDDEYIIYDDGEDYYVMDEHGNYQRAEMGSGLWEICLMLFSLPANILKIFTKDGEDE